MSQRIFSRAVDTDNVPVTFVCVHLLLNLKGSFFEPAVGSLPNVARVCGYRRY